MAGIYINKNDLEECAKLVKIGRRKKVHFTSNGWYFNWNGKRVKCDELMVLSYPIFYEDKNGKLYDIGCYLPASNCISILVEIDSDTETVQMYRELD